jgi:hypothetical protein
MTNSVTVRVQPTFLRSDPTDQNHAVPDVELRKTNPHFADPFELNGDRYNL